MHVNGKIVRDLVYMYKGKIEGEGAAWLNDWRRQTKPEHYRGTTLFIFQSRFMMLGSCSTPISVKLTLLFAKLLISQVFRLVPPVKKLLNLNIIILIFFIIVTKLIVKTQILTQKGYWTLFFIIILIIYGYIWKKIFFLDTETWSGMGCGHCADWGDVKVEKKLLLCLMYIQW